MLLAAAGASGAEAGICGNLPTWGVGPQLAEAVYGPASTTANGLVYVASGGTTFPTGAPLSLRFQRYDPTSNAWTLLADVPTPVFGATLAHDAAGGRLFLFGGSAGAPAGTQAVHVYNIGSNTWIPNFSQLPAPRFAMASGVIGGKIYLVGGFESLANVATSQNWEFDPADGTYTNQASLPTPQARTGFAVSGGQLYVISGVNQNGLLVQNHYRYTPPPIDMWDPRTPIPNPVNQPGATAIGAMTPICHGDIMIVSGGTPVLGTNITQLYDVATNTWSSGPPLTTGRFALRAEQVGDTILAFGGYDAVAGIMVDTVDKMQGPPLPVELQSLRVE